MASLTTNFSRKQGTTPKATPDAPLPSPTPAPTPEVLRSTLETLNKHLTNIYSHLEPQTAFLIITGHSDPRRMSALNARKAKFEMALKSGKAPEELAVDVKWTSQDGRDLEEAVELARRGLLFLGIKY